MGYAVRKDGKGWRTVESSNDITTDEKYQTAEPAPIQPGPPQIVSMRQARLALLNAGLLQSVNDAVAGLQGAAGEAARIEWEYATEVRRDNTLFTALAAELNFTDEMLNGLFTEAATL